MKKIFSVVVVLVASLIFSVGQCFAEIESVKDIDKKMQVLEKLYKYDMSLLYNKSEIIGQRRDSFQKEIQNYKRNVKMTITILEKTKQEITNLADQGESDLTISNLYLSADNALYDFDNKTFDFLQKIESIMPTITYQKFKKKFETFYESLKIVEDDLSIK